MEDINCWESKFVACEYVTEFLNRIEFLNQTSENKVDILEVKKALYYVKKYFGDKTRKSGEPFYSHPIYVACMAAERNFFTEVIVAGILHDNAEDTTMNVGMILNIFGWRVAHIVDHLTRENRPDGVVLSVGRLLEISYEADDIDALILKLFDRVDNMRTVGVKPPEGRIKTATETMTSFITLTMKLGYRDIEDMLVAMCAEILNPKDPKAPLSNLFRGDRFTSLK